MTVWFGKALPWSDLWEKGSGAHATQNNCPLLGKEVGFLYARVYQALAVGL